MDLENLHATRSRIICSALVTRYSTFRKAVVSKDDKDEFCVLESLKKKKDTNTQPSEDSNYSRSRQLLLKKKHRGKDADRVIKRFKHSLEHKNNAGPFKEGDNKGPGTVSGPVSNADKTFSRVKLCGFQHRKCVDTFILKEKSTGSVASEVDERLASSSTDMLYSDEEFKELIHSQRAYITPQ